MRTNAFTISAAACAILSLSAMDASAWGCVRGGGGGVARGGVVVYNNGGYGAYPYGGCYGAGFAAGGGPAALVGGPQQNPDYIPIPAVPPVPPVPQAPPMNTAPPVDPMSQGIQYGPYSPGVYSRPVQQSGTPL